MEPILIGVSPSMEKIKRLIKSVAGSGVNVVISGESGVGKEVVAQRLYLASPRNGKPFVKINCAALPEALLESELFGYEQGAFTGAVRNKRGKFTLAHDGVLFLDEISEMSPLHQSKLLHVLQEGRFSPLGSEKEVTSDTWIISATNKPLPDLVKNQSFRQDLYFRLNVITIDIPPLRRRPEDIPALVTHYLDKFTTRFKIQMKITPGQNVMEKLMAYHWPGNIRELQNILQRYIVLHNWEEIIDEISGKPRPAEKTKTSFPNVFRFSPATAR